MALPYRASIVILVGLLAACSEDGARGGFQLEIYENPAECDVSAGTCYDEAGEELVQQKIAGGALVSRLASSFEREGLLFSTTVPLANGRIATLEFDASTYAMPGELPRIYYSEYLGNEKVFRSTHVSGLLSLPPIAECPCSEGRMELDIVDAGPDGVVGTEDDLRRRITRGLIRTGSRYCTTGKMQPISDTLEVDATRCIIPSRPSRPSSGAPHQPPGYYGDADYYGGCDGDYYYDDDHYSDEGGCGGEEPASYGDEGCEADDFDSSSSSGGCETDSSDTACEGSSSGGEACSDVDCEGDAIAAVGKNGSKRRKSGPGTLPFILGVLWLTARHRRRKRQQRYQSC